MRAFEPSLLESVTTVISFTSAPRMRMSPCPTFSLRVPGLEGSLKAMVEVDSSARTRAAVRKAQERARSALRRIMNFMEGGGWG